MQKQQKCGKKEKKKEREREEEEEEEMEMQAQPSTQVALPKPRDPSRAVQGRVASYLIWVSRSFSL